MRARYIYRGGGIVDYLNQLERVLGAGHSLVAMETYDVERVLDLFNRMSRYSSRAIYSWAPTEGMRRLGAPHIAIPGTQSPRGILEHIQGVQHYGIYLLRGFNEPMEDAGIQALLRQIATDKTHPKAVVLLAERVILPSALKPFTLRSKHQLREAS